jgi:hypothetical protein
VDLDPATANLQDPAQVRALLDAAAAAMLGCRHRRGSCVHLPAAGRLLLTGDLHDNPTHLDAVRRAAQLVLAFPGQVHVVLANHELAQAFRQPVSKGAGDNLELFDGGLDWAFGDDAGDVADAIARFVRAMPLALRTANGLHLSHSLPSPIEMEGFDMAILDRPLGDADYAHRTGSAWRMVWGRGWTREQLAGIAKAWGTRLFVIGHAHVETGAESPLPGLLVLNTDHERGRVVPVSLSEPLPSAEELVLHSVPVASLGAIDG